MRGAGRATRPEWKGFPVVGGPGDVEVDPRHRDELADEEGALDQRPLGRARVLEVAVPALHLGDVIVDERKLPVAFAGTIAGRHDLVVEVLRRPERPGHEVAKRARDGPRQRGDIDQVRGTEPFRVGERVTEDQAALGVGVGDVDLLAVERGDDVAGPGRMRPGHVLDGGRDRQERRSGRQARDRGDSRDHGARTGLVHLHLFHPGRRLDADPTRIEADALADDGEVTIEAVALPFLPGAHDDHPRRVVAPPTDRHEHPHPQLGRLLGLDHVDPEAVLLGDRARLVGEDLRADVVGGPVREGPGDVRTLRDDDPALGGRGQRRTIRTRGDKDQFVEDRGDRVDLGAIDRAGVVGTFDHSPGDQLGRSGRIATEPAGERGEPDREPLDGATTESSLSRGRHPHDRFSIERRDVAHADRQQTSRGGLPARSERGRVALAGEFPERDERLEFAAGAPVELAERAIEGRRCGDGDDEEVRGHVPRLIGDDT